MDLKKSFTTENAKKNWKKAIDYIIGAAVGAIAGSLFSSNFWQAIIFASVLTILLIVHIVLSNKSNSNCDILKILNNELKSKNYVAVIRIGYVLSRPLHLSGRRTLRNEIGHLIKLACDQMQITDTVIIDDKKILVGYIKAKTLIDDLGWTSFQLKRLNSSIDNIKTGISLALEIKEYKLAVKGYRHLIGILNNSQDEELKAKTIKEANNIINSTEYKDSFNNEFDYKHAKAEFDYSFARTLVDSNPAEALKIALEVQETFKSDIKNDKDRYVKTFDLIGDIYARSENPSTLKKAKETYHKGIIECEKCGRTERLLRISEDYIKLLIKMTRINNIYDLKSWQDIDKEEKVILKKAIEHMKKLENSGDYVNFSKLHKQYTKSRSKYGKNNSIY